MTAKFCPICNNPCVEEKCRLWIKLGRKENCAIVEIPRKIDEFIQRANRPTRQSSFR